MFKKSEELEEVTIWALELEPYCCHDFSCTDYKVGCRFEFLGFQWIDSTDFFSDRENIWGDRPVDSPRFGTFANRSLKEFFDSPGTFWSCLCLPEKLS